MILPCYTPKSTKQAGHYSTHAVSALIRNYHLIQWFFEMSWRRRWRMYCIRFLVQLVTILLYRGVRMFSARIAVWMRLFSFRVMLGRVILWRWFLCVATVSIGGSNRIVRLVVSVRCRTEIANNWGYMIEGKLEIHIAVAGRGISKVWKCFILIIIKRNWDEHSIVC